jgi:hypothetical protein
VRHQPASREIVEAALAAAQVDHLVALCGPGAADGGDALLRQRVEELRRPESVQRHLRDHHLVADVEHAIHVEQHARGALL